MFTRVLRDHGEKAGRVVRGSNNDVMRAMPNVTSTRTGQSADVNVQETDVNMRVGVVIVHSTETAAQGVDLLRLLKIYGTPVSGDD